MENVNNIVLEEENVIDLRELFFLVFKNFWLIAIITVLITTIVGLFSYFGIEKKYESSTMVTVIAHHGGSNQSSDTLRVSSELATRFSIIAESNNVLLKVSEKLEKDHNIKIGINELKKLFTISPINNTDILELKVTYTDPEIAAYLADTITEQTIMIYEEAIGSTEEVKVIDEAMVNDKPVSPNLLLNTIIGFIVGGILSVGIILFKELFNRKVRSQRDIESLGLPYLGNIPEFTRSSNR